MKKKVISILLAVTMVFMLIITPNLPQPITAATGGFTDDQYVKAMWMVTRYYGAQRSGEGPNWLLMDHKYKTSFVKDKDGSNDLVGGWFDCGDHVLFGQTFFYSAYMLALACKAFPEGAHDLYDGIGYTDYAASKNWAIEGGSPSGVPDLLEEIKYATDWMIKATPNSSTFYSQKGNGDKDHQQWVTSGKMSTLPEANGGESDKSREITKNPADGVMPSYAAATLAVMSEIYRPYDSAYADLCLEHAKNAYAYAKANKTKSIGSGGFYGAHKDPETIFIVAASEMYMATNESTYKSDIDTSKLKDHYHILDYSNSHDLAYYAAAMALPDKKSSILSDMKKNFIDKYANNINSEGAQKLGGDWGQLRYSGNAAFSMALYANATGSTSYDDLIYKQIDYILGKNNSKQSFIVGFDENNAKSPAHPHHRNVFLNDDNPSDSKKQSLTIPERNEYFGGLVGGNRSSGSYNDNINSYQDTEGGIDYNAGLLGALCSIVSKVSPASDAKAPCEDGHTPKSTNCTECSKCKETLTRSCTDTNHCTAHTPPCTTHNPKTSNCTECSKCTAINLNRSCTDSSYCDFHAPPPPVDATITLTAVSQGDASWNETFTGSTKITKDGDYTVTIEGAKGNKYRDLFADVNELPEGVTVTLNSFKMNSATVNHSVTTPLSSSNLETVFWKAWGEPNVLTDIEENGGLFYLTGNPVIETITLNFTVSGAGGTPSTSEPVSSSSETEPPTTEPPSSSSETEPPTTEPPSSSSETEPPSSSSEPPTTEPDPNANDYSCKKCALCGECKSAFKTGHILGNPTIGIGDALDILMYLANMNSSLITQKGEGSHPWNAALITSTKKPKIADALQILMHLSGMPSKI